MKRLNYSNKGVEKFMKVKSNVKAGDGRDGRDDLADIITGSGPGASPHVK
jgi:hypothetical protein